MEKNINYLNKINLLIQEEKDFSIYVSKQKKKIVMDDEFGKRGAPIKFFYADKKLNPAIFHLSNKIKDEADVYFLENPTEKERPRNVLKYYNYNIDQFNNIDRFYYIDFSACYLTVLKNKGVISNELFIQINKLPKQDRLICLGMLAYEPFKITYIKGKRFGPIVQMKNEYSHVFYYACSLTQELMSDIIRRINNNYIFYWVDGIFFKNPVIYYAVRDYLKSIGMTYRFGSCYGFKYIDKDKYFNISFMQSDKNKFDPKRYNIPAYFRDMELRRGFYEHLLNGNYAKAADISDELNKFGEIK